MEKTVGLIMLLLSGYLSCGLLFAIPFVAKGVTTIDPDGARGTGWGFRLIIIPGTMVFWPLLLKKWIKASGKKND
jgi:hypothetical protein